MRPCIDIVDKLGLSNTAQTNQLGMAYCTEVPAILQYLTPTIAYDILLLHHWNRQTFQISHQRAACILQPSRDQYIRGLVLHISFFGNKGFKEKDHHCGHGTMTHQQKGILKELKPVAEMEKRSGMHVYHTKEKILLVSHINKKSLKKNVIVLSTMHDNVEITKDQRKNPMYTQSMTTQNEA